MSRNPVTCVDMVLAEGAEGCFYLPVRACFCPLFETIQRSAAILRTLRRIAITAGQGRMARNRTLGNPPHKAASSNQHPARKGHAA